MELLSRLDSYEIGRRYLLARANKIEPTIVDTRGSNSNVFVGSMSFIAAAISRQLGSGIKSLLLDGARDEDLDRYAFDRYQLLKKGAAAALGASRFVRPNATGGPGSIDAGTVIQSLTGIEYVLTTTATFGVGDLQAEADVRAVQAGKSQQVGRNQLRRFKNPGSIFDPSIQVTNPEPTAGGEDVEGYEAFRERIRDFWRTARRGILAAIEFGAKSVPGVDSAFAIEALTGDAQPARVVSMYIADSSGVASKQLGDLVSTQLMEYRAAGIAVVLSLSLPQMITIRLQLAFIAGVATATIGLSIRTAIVETVNALGSNQTLLKSLLSNVLTRYANQGLIVKDSSIIEPVGDLVPNPGFTLRTNMTLVTIV